MASSRLVIEEPGIIIDSREHKLIEKIAKTSYKYETKQLDIGDVLLHGTLLIERKAVPDLISSIKSDGRYATQKERLNASGLKYCYIIEGSEPDKYDYNTFAGFMTNNQLRGIVVYRTSTTTETLRLIIWLSNNVARFGEVPQSKSDLVGGTITGLGAQLAMKRSDNITKDTFIQYVLRLVPGFGPVKVKSMIEKYQFKSIGDIIRHQNTGKDKELAKLQELLG
jgi:ERCC4-type nuclease